MKQNTVRHEFHYSLILLLINATSTIATARYNGSVLKNCNLSAFASNCDNLRKAYIFNICSSDVYRRSRPSTVMDSVHGHNLKWTHSRMDTIPNEHLHLYSYFDGL